MIVWLVNISTEYCAFCGIDISKKREHYAKISASSQAMGYDSLCSKPLASEDAICVFWYFHP